tara:strand:+ start:4450 stop:5289 length:840 start_codon:yes stop_codon:yes gene_type:complete
MQLLPNEAPKVYHLANWGNLNEPQRLDIIADIIRSYGRDPKIATKAVSILWQAGVAPRDYVKQAAVLLKWVQDNIYYVNEPGERLQDPLYTLKVGYGDCDDMVIVLNSFYESIRMPWKLVISGPDASGKKKRYIHGDRFRKDARYAHIYSMVGDRPFGPKTWYYAEPTIRGVPLGWDVVDSDDHELPELLAPAYGAFGVNPMALAVGTSIGMEERALRQKSGGGASKSFFGKREGLWGLPTGISPHMKEQIRGAIFAGAVGVITTLVSEFLLERVKGKK